MKNPTREFARRVYRLHRRSLLKASFLAAGPLGVLNCVQVFLNASGLIPSWVASLAYTAAACLLYPLTLSFTRTCVRTLLEADPAVQDPFYDWKDGRLAAAWMLGVLLQGPVLVIGAGAEALDTLLPSMTGPWMWISTLVLLAAAVGLFWFTLSVFLVPYLYIGKAAPLPSLPGESWNRMRGCRLSLLAFLVPLYLLFLIPFLLFSWPGTLLAANLAPLSAALVRTAAAFLSGVFQIAVNPYIVLAQAAFAEPLVSAKHGHR